MAHYIYLAKKGIGENSGDRALRKPASICGHFELTFEIDKSLGFCLSIMKTDVKVSWTSRKAINMQK